jgi:hypothetical protein
MTKSSTRPPLPLRPTAGDWRRLKKLGWEDPTHQGHPLPFQCALRRHPEGGIFDEGLFRRFLGDLSANTRDEDGYSALAYCGYPLEQLPLLLDLGLDPTQPEPDGQTALHVLSSNELGKPDNGALVSLVARLLDMGVDPEQWNDAGERFTDGKWPGEEKGWKKVLDRARILQEKRQLETVIETASPARSAPAKRL